MVNMLDCILLIDDSKAANVFHQAVIEKTNYFKYIKSARGGAEALEYLGNVNTEGYLKPNLIFLDINMPGINGWHFLEEYEKLDNEFKSGTIILMLTTSLNKVDQIRAEENELISGFVRKPLTEKHLKEVMPTYFSS